MPNLEMIPFQRPRGQMGQVARVAQAIGPSIARAAANQAVRSFASSLPSLEGAGRYIGQLSRGVQSGRKAKSNPGPSRTTDTNLQRAVIAPVAVSNPRVSRTATIKNMGKVTRVTHRELILPSLPGSVNWAILSTFNLNPGLPATFPWLSTIASNFAEYRFNSLMFEFVPIAATSTQGEVILTPEYNSSANPPVTEQESVDHRDTIADSCWKRIVMKLSPADLHALGPRKFIRQYSIAGDIKTYDSGQVFIQAANQLTSATIGKIYIHYSVDLFTPVLENPTILPSQTDVYALTSNQTFLTGTSQFFNPVGYVTPKGILGSFNESNGPIFLPRGAWRFFYSLTAENGTVGSLLCSVNPLFNSSSTAVYGGDATASTTTSGLTLPFVDVSGSGLVIADGINAFVLSVSIVGTGGPLTLQTGSDLIFELA